jgi:flagellar biosynthesis GTPase FlhF
MFRDGLFGGQDAFARHVRKLATRLATDDPEMATALQSELGRDPAVRALHANPVDADSRQRLLQETYPVLLPRAPVWNAQVTQELHRVVSEWRGADRLREAGLNPTRSVLLSGPPGVGKTLAASWLAMELDVPLLTLDLATVMNS